MEIVFVHGWGFSADLWKPLQKKLLSHNCSMIDLGYFDTSPTAIEQLPDNALYIGHSLGVLWILKNIPEKMTALISINGFDCFYRYFPKETLSQMKSGLNKNPKIQLSSFYKQCGLKKIKIPKSINVNNLMEGLDLLSDLDLSTQKDDLKIPISVLASQNDFIVSEEMTKTIWHNYSIIWSEDGSHILPLTKAQWCSSHILNFIKQL